MLINTEQMISMSEAVREISRRLIARNRAAYEELAK